MSRVLTCARLSDCGQRTEDIPGDRGRLAFRGVLQATPAEPHGGGGKPRPGVGPHVSRAECPLAPPSGTAPLRIALLVVVYMLAITGNEV